MPFLGVLVIRILLFRELYWGPLFSETPRLGFTVVGFCSALGLLVLLRGLRWTAPDFSPRLLGLCVFWPEPVSCDDVRRPD